MGQRLATIRTPKQSFVRDHAVSIASVDLSVFETELGWFGLVGHHGAAIRLYIGHATPVDLHKKMDKEFGETAVDAIDWNPALRQQLEDFACGTPVEFSRFETRYFRQTQFQAAVVQAARRIPYGKTCSYGELARAAGSPGAARAVGTVMSSNLLPIIVPCHRVLAAGGKLGGFSAPRGIQLKKQMLALESITIP